MEYGLIGAKLGHSYSKIIHEMLCGYHYDLCPLPTEEEARAFLAKRQFKAINVTIPYKKLVMEYCSYIDPRAKAIGAVNTVVNKNGLLYGYNTDYMGFAHLCDAHGVNFAGKRWLFWAPAAPTTPPALWPGTRARQRCSPSAAIRTRKRAS